MTRAEWRAFYRLMRIARRESYKAMIDMLLFGIGACEVGPDIPDLIRHIPAEHLRFEVARG